MIQTIDAIYTQGMLKPLEALRLKEQQHVRVTIEATESEARNGHAAALERLIERLRRSTLSYGGSRLSREELHDRDRHV